MYNFSRVSYGRTSIKKQVAMQDSMVTDLFTENEELKKRVEELEQKLLDVVDDMQDTIDEQTEAEKTWQELLINEEENHSITLSMLEDARADINSLEQELEQYRVIEDKTGLVPAEVADMVSSLQTTLEAVKCPNCS